MATKNQKGRRTIWLCVYVKEEEGERNGYKMQARIPLSFLSYFSVQGRKKKKKRNKWSVRVTITHIRLLFF
ncbi:hypothetical protein LguiA_016082 [Lonicera macranthoides]